MCKYQIFWCNKFSIIKKTVCNCTTADVTNTIQISVIIFPVFLFCFDWKFLLDKVGTMIDANPHECVTEVFYPVVVVMLLLLLSRQVC